MSLVLWSNEIESVSSIENTMKKLFDLLKAPLLASEKVLFYHYVPRRGVRYQETLKWVKPEKKPIYHPARSGDLVMFPKINCDKPYLPFEESKELQNADEKVKKVFSLNYHTGSYIYESYKEELVKRVRSHPLDQDSVEVIIAQLTARIRYYQKLITERPTKTGPYKTRIKLLIESRKKKLRLLRLSDYKKFEWLLEKIELEFRPAAPVRDNGLTRKKSVTRLARLRVEEAKEEKLAALKQALDKEKIPFLEKKIKKLKEIKELEEKNNLPSTISDSDIEECIKKLESVKVEIAEKVKKGYKRKIHPYHLEPHDEETLWKKEKEGELIREQQEMKSLNTKNKKEGSD